MNNTRTEVKQADVTANRFTQFLLSAMFPKVSYMARIECPYCPEGQFRGRLRYCTATQTSGAAHLPLTENGVRRRYLPIRLPRGFGHQRFNDARAGLTVPLFRGDPVHLPVPLRFHCFQNIFRARAGNDVRAASYGHGPFRIFTVSYTHLRAHE